MTYRNPWIDPRVAAVRAEAARDYLLRHGWAQAPSDRSRLLPFEKTADDGTVLTVFLPTEEQARDFRQRVIELIGDLALGEDRSAFDVLNEILPPSVSSAENPNGLPLSAPRSPGPPTSLRAE